MSYLILLAREKEQERAEDILFFNDDMGPEITVVIVAYCPEPRLSL
jgi:hypothetical protein